MEKKSESMKNPPLIIFIVPVFIVVMIIATLINLGRDEEVSYNVSMRDVTLSSVCKNPRTTNLFELRGIKDEKVIMYEIETIDLYISLQRTIKTQTVSNPGGKIILDMIYNSDIEKITAVALVKQK